MLSSISYIIVKTVLKSSHNSMVLCNVSTVSVIKILNEVESLFKVVVEQTLNCSGVYK